VGTEPDELTKSDLNLLDVVYDRFSELLNRSSEILVRCGHDGDILDLSLIVSHPLLDTVSSAKAVNKLSWIAIGASATHPKTECLHI